MPFLKSLIFLFLLIPLNAYSYPYYDTHAIVDLENGIYPFSDASYWDHPAMYGSSKVDWVSGRVAYSRFRLFDTSEFNISGGLIDGNLMTYDNAVSNVNGGRVDFAISSWDTSKMFINGGTIRYASSHSSSEVIYSGGTIDFGIAVKDSSTLTVVGHDLEYNYTGRDDIFGYDRYLLTGIFQNGDFINTELRLYDTFTGAINLVAPNDVPEPTSLSLFILAVLFFMYMANKQGNTFRYRGDFLKS